tara:strand:- start:2522 stop:4135 length:1614 start_codon:yes stop_codon:yes gene_type:complete
MLSRSRWFLTAVVSSVLLLVTSCNRVSPIDEARSQNLLLITVGSEPSTLDPHRCTGSPESFIMLALWEPLVDWNETATGMVPAAAANWEISEDGRTYTFHLRPEAKWSNGEPITATDWVRSFQRWLTPSIAAELGNFGDPIVGAFEFRTGANSDPDSVGIRSPGEHTLEIELTEPDVLFLDRLTGYPFFPLHEASVEAAGGFFNPMADFLRPDRLITNGPFTMTEWKYGQYVQVERNPHHHAPPRLNAIRFLAFDNLDTMERSYRSGQLHIIDSLPASKIEGYREAQDPALVTLPRVGTRYLSFNTTNPPFDDTRVRRAFALAIDRQQLVDAVLRTGGAPALSLIRGTKDGHQPTSLITESVEEARQLMAAAGYPEGKDFPAVEYLYNTLDRNRQMAEAYQQMWQASLGVKVSLRNEEWKVFLDTRRQLQYQISRAGWLPFSPEPAELYELVTTNSPANESGWSHADYDRVFDAARQEMNPKKRYQLYDELDQILLDEMPLVPVGFYSRNKLIHPSLEGWPANHMEGMVWNRIGFKD